MYFQQYFRDIGNMAVSFSLVENTGVPRDICHFSRKINNLRIIILFYYIMPILSEKKYLSCHMVANLIGPEVAGVLVAKNR